MLNEFVEIAECFLHLGATNCEAASCLRSAGGEKPGLRGKRLPSQTEDRNLVRTLKFPFQHRVSQAAYDTSISATKDLQNVWETCPQAKPIYPENERWFVLPERIAAAHDALNLRGGRERTGGQ
jgi:hypothetical protein